MTDRLFKTNDFARLFVNLRDGQQLVRHFETNKACESNYLHIAEAVMAGAELARLNPSRFTKGETFFRVSEIVSATWIPVDG